MHRDYAEVKTSVYFQNCRFFVRRLIIRRDGKKLHLFGHLLRNTVAQIIAQIARQIKILHGF